MSIKDKVLEHLQSGKTLTALEALDKFGCMQLNTRIHELKKEGNNIETTLVSNGKKRWGIYKLKQENTDESN